MNKFLKNASTLMIANAISFLISTLVTLIVPKVISVSDYSYFQLYLFYINYLGFFCIGWIDGIVLRYGGSFYDKLDKSLFKRQFRLYSYLELFFSLVVILLALISNPTDNKGIVYLFVGLALFLVEVNAFFRYLRQAVNDIDVYAHNIILEKFIYLIGVIAVLILRKYQFYFLIIADLIGKAVSLIHILIVDKDILKARSAPLGEGLIEAKKNISVGIKLLLANGSSMLIVGIIRFAIQRHWDVETFGKISLSLSISNMFILFVQAIGVSLFPMLKRMDESRAVSIYTRIRKVLTVVMFSLIATYYPIYVALSAWLPNYSKSLRYVAIMFPVCIFESKMQLLIEPYLKSLREESKLLKGNILAVLLSCLSVLICVVLLSNLDYTVISIVFVLAIRSIILEKVVERRLDIRIQKEIIIEIILTALFIVFNWTIGGWTGFTLYIAVIVAYCIYDRDSIKYIYQTGLRIIHRTKG